MEDKTEKYFVGVRFPTTDKTYYYSTKTTELVPGDLVIVNSEDNLEAATVVTTVMNQQTHKTSLELKPIIRKATATDVRIYKANLAHAQECMAIAQKEVNARNMPMDFVAAAFSFSGDVITLTYTSTEKRVDFRELLPVLGSKLRARVSLRQIASRDRAKMIGGIGICGLPLCCSTFLTNFESIGIAKMKNQMLAINIPKYSGPCDKLMCCLAYEDETYTIEKKDFPRVGQEVKVDGEPYTVNSFNIVSRTVRLANADKSDFQTVPLEDCIAMIKGTYKPHPIEKKGEEEYKLPDFGVSSKASNFERNSEELEENRQNRGDKNGSNKPSDSSSRRNDRNNRNRDKNNRNNRGNNNQGKDNPKPEENGNRDNSRNHNRHNRDRNNRNNRNNNNGNQSPKQQNNNQKPRDNGSPANNNGNPNNGNKPHNRNRRRHHGGKPNNKPGEGE
ncbi:MAG: hypothetical protein K6B65_00760 [Bacilli bacterium]|nr:hypothetical protein [Bacilli bacterium]